MERVPPASEVRDRVEHDRARRLIAGRIFERGIAVSGHESDIELESLLDAIEAFEAARMRLGGDSFTNALGSSEPDDPRLVLPRRVAEEPLLVYAARIRTAATALAAPGD